VVGGYARAIQSLHMQVQADKQHVAPTADRPITSAPFRHEYVQEAQLLLGDRATRKHAKDS